MIEAPEALSEAVRIRIIRDMEPSLLTIYSKCGLAVLLGGAISLLVCGQFGVGMTHAAHLFNHTVHSHADDLGLALTSGIVFALVPPFILRLLCSPLQFRIVTRKNPNAAILWFIGFGAALAHHGDMGANIFVFGLWCAAALTTFVGLSRLIHRIAGKRLLSFAPNKA